MYAVPVPHYKWTNGLGAELDIDNKNPDRQPTPTIITPLITKPSHNKNDQPASMNYSDEDNEQ
jgi:hypothetical protein